MRRTPSEFEHQLRTAEKDLDGLNRLEALVQVFEHLSFVYDEALALARKQEYSWDEIGEVFEIKKQSAWERFRERLGE